MIFIIMLYPKIELQSFSRSAEPLVVVDGSVSRRLHAPLRMVERRPAVGRLLSARSLEESRQLGLAPDVHHVARARVAHAYMICI